METSDELVFKTLQSWLAKAAASDYLPERTGYSFAYGEHPHYTETPPAKLLGMTRLRELQLRYKLMVNEFEASAVLQRKKRTYLDLFHPFQFTVIHGKWFRSISIAEIAAIEFLYWKKTYERTSNKGLVPAITIILADNEFDRHSARVFEQLHAFFELPGPPALTPLHEEIVRSFFCIPLSQFKAQIVASTSSKLRGSVLISPAEHSVASDFYDLMQRVHWIAEQTQNQELATGFPPRLILRIPSLGGPALSTWLFHDTDKNPFPPQGLQRIYALALSSQDEHEQIVLARNGIPDFFTQQFVLASYREKNQLHLVVRSCESDLEWNNEEIRRVFVRLTLAAMPTTSSSSPAKERPHLRGLLSASPWTEVDEYFLPYATDEEKLTLPEVVDSLKYQIHGEAKMIVFCFSKTFLDIQQETLPPDRHPHLCFVNLDDDNACARIHTEGPDWLLNVSFVCVWFAKEAATDATMDMQNRLFFFLSLVQSKELSGFSLRCNHPTFMETLLLEKQKRENYLHRFLYTQRRIQTFSSLCAAGSDSELATYITNQPV